MSVTSTQAWNDYLLQFLDELTETFPECNELYAARSAAEAMMDEDETEIMNQFVAEIEPHHKALTEMDETFILNSGIEFLNQLNIARYWTDDLEQETKDAIWQYIQSLFVMGKTIQNVPPQLLQALEGYAGRMMTQLQGADPGNLDLMALGKGALQHMQQQEPDTFNATFQGNPMAAALFGNTVPSTPANTPDNQTRGQTTSQGQAIGFDRLAQMLQSQPPGGPFQMPGLSEALAETQQSVNIQQNGPIPHPDGFRQGRPVNRK